MSVKAGESVTYFVRLSEAPTADGWWVRVHVDGAVRADGKYKGLRWVPSVGWEFDQDDWDVWRGITMRAMRRWPTVRVPGPSGTTSTAPSSRWIE